jgi:predicted metal-binding protein
MNKIDYQNNDYDFILQVKAEQQTAAILQKAMACDLFTAIEEGKSFSDLTDCLHLDEKGTFLFLDVLDKMGLIIRKGGYLSNAPVSAKYLSATSPFFSLNALKNSEISGIFIAEKLSSMLAYFRGNVFLDSFTPDVFSPSIQAFMTKQCIGISFDDQLPYDLIITGTNYEEHAEIIIDDAVIAVMGRYAEEYSLYTAINLYEDHLLQKDSSVLSANIFSAKDVSEFLETKQMHQTPLLSLTDDISVIFASKNRHKLEELAITKKAQIYARLKRLAIQSITMINPQDVVTAHWAKDHCRYGCSSYGEKCCPPNSPSYEETRVKLDGYTKAFLIEGQPPTRDFQKLMLNAEKIAFEHGFYKAFSFWAGPCHICSECKPPQPPKKCTATRPSMESAGIDVFATVSKQGFTMRTLKDKQEFVKYFGLLLLE